MRLLVLSVVTLIVVEVLYRAVEKPMIRVGRLVLDGAAPRPVPRFRKAILAGLTALVLGFVSGIRCCSPSASETWRAAWPCTRAPGWTTRPPRMSS